MENQLQKTDRLKYYETLCQTAGLRPYNKSDRWLKLLHQTNMIGSAVVSARQESFIWVAFFLVLAVVSAWAANEV